jgi:hypothetical protein
MAEETSPAPQDDWIVDATDTIIGYVDKARSLGTDNAVRALRGIVFGLVALVFGLAALIFTVVLLVRLADAYLPIGSGVGDATWAAHLFIGTLLSILGFGLWASRKTTSMRNVVLAGVLDLVIIVVIACYAIFS